MAVEDHSPDMNADERAARLLVTPTALQTLSLEDAIKIVAYLQPRVIEAGCEFVREGEAVHNDHMLLVLEGDLSVHNSSLQDDDDHLVVRVMGPGSLIGELGLLDGGPRSASCVANTDMLVGVLSRADFLQLLQDDPAVGSRLLLAISKRMADTLRETTRKLILFAQMNKVLSEELAKVANDPDWFDS
ncbi:cyclic nucleotide-binding domain-containing protein [Hydrogenophaga defluvii]|uniref:cyclic nucleotide-binding domain-containing protein n=1 Tax=Hydrogenophaga defluvii TaxID=249410 RepID=UPI0036D362E4